MLTFIMLTRLSPEALRSPSNLEDLEKKTMEHIRKECPKVEWVGNYAILGPCDYLDIFTAPDLEAAMSVATIIRSYGHATTEIWTATEWKKYKQIVRHLPGGLSLKTTS
ncbi:MAG: GYD domain-containing protein [Geobacteraceae bacterium]|nr:GYD domain-containing protein [Geobacteraceae bacterium]